MGRSFAVRSLARPRARSAARPPFRRRRSSAARSESRQTSGEQERHGKCAITLPEEEGVEKTRGKKEKLAADKNFRVTEEH